MPSSILSFKKKGKLGSWLSNKLALSKRKSDASDGAASEYSEPAACSPLMGNMDANNPRKKHMPRPLPGTTPMDDCNQLLLSSDQASALARIEDHPNDSYPSEHYGSECSVPESVLAATSHMATIRNLLVNHISETHDASTIQERLAAAPATAATAPAACRSVAASTSTAAGRRSSRDRTVQALLADQMQLLDLVQTLIADHRTSLLERQRLQQQLSAAEKALHTAQLDKERAAALAEVRAEQVTHVQADLAVASAAVKKLHSVRAISSQRISLPPTDEHADDVSTPRSDQSGMVSPSQLTPSKCSAIIGRIAPENSWQDQHAIVGPAPPGCKHQPLAAGALATQPAGLRSNRSKPTGSRASSAKAAASASSSRGLASKHTSSSQRLSSSSGRRAAGSAASGRGVSSSQQGSRQRRLLTESSRGSVSGSSQQVSPSGAAAAVHKFAAQESSKHSQQQQQQQGSSPDASVHVQVLQQQQEEQQHREAISAAAAQHAATVAAAPSAASKLAQVHASALESLLLQRLHSSSTELEGAGQQQLLTASIETDGSALSMAWAGAGSDAVAAAAGLTKQQLKQLLHKPWLVRASQEEVASVLQHKGQPSSATAAAGMVRSHVQPKHQHHQRRQQPKQQQQQYFGTATAESDGSGGADSEDVEDEMIQDSASESSSGTNHECEEDALDSCSDDSEDTSSMTGNEGLEPSAAGADSRTAGRKVHQLQQQQHHGTLVGAGRGSGEARVSASNGSSWPAVKVSSMAAGAVAGSPGPRPGINKPSPHKRPAARSRSRTQPVQVSTSLESAATLPVAAQAGPQSHGSQSSCMTTAAGSAYGDMFMPVHEGGSAPRSKDNAQQRLEQQRQQQQLAAVDMSCDLVQQASMESLQPAAYRRKQQTPTAAAGAHVTSPQAQQGAFDNRHGQQRKPRISSGSRQQQVLSPSSTATAGQSPGQAYAASIYSDGDVSTASDFACPSVASGFTAGSTYSNIDFAPKSVTKARPAGVPKLLLPTGVPGSSPAQQQQPQQQQHNHHRDSPRDKARLLAQQHSDMAPLKAQKGTPRGSAASRGGAAGIERAGGSFTMGAAVKAAAGSALSGLGLRSQSLTAGHNSTAAAASPATVAGTGSSSTTVSSPTASSSKPPAAMPSAAGTGSNPGTISRVSSAGTAAAAAAAGVPYWGSSAGSYPASEEPSRIPTPTVENSSFQTYVPAAAALSVTAAAGSSAAAAVAVGDDAASDGGLVAAASSQQYHLRQLPPHLQVTVAAAAAGGLAPAIAAVAAQTAAVLTPRTATGTFMTMRPTHLYKSVSTQFAMYSPLRGNLHALGQNKPGGSPGATGAESADESDNVTGYSNTVGALGATTSSGVSRELSSNSNVTDYQWHHLLGPVPEEEGVIYDSLAAAEGQHLLPAAAGAEGASLQPAAEDSGFISNMLQRTASHGSTAYTASPSPELMYATSLPTLEDFQRMVQQEQQQRELELRQQRQLEQQPQQHQLERKMSLDVVSKGPVYMNASANFAEVLPSPARTNGSSRRIRGSSITSSQQRVSLHASLRAAATPTAGAPPTAAATPAIAANEPEAAVVGPLTASSPTRKRSSAVLSSSNTGIAAVAGSSSTAAASQQQQRRSREPHYSASTSSSRARANSTDLAAVVRIEPAAAAVAQRVAAVGVRASTRQSQQQQQQQPGQDAAAADESEQQMVGSSSGGQRIRRRWNHQQQDAAAAAGSHEAQQSPPAVTAAAAAGVESSEQVAAAQHTAKRQHTTSSSGRGKISSSKGSASKSSSRRTSNAGLHTPPTAAAAAVPDCDDMVTSYHNPMLMFEGLDAADEAAMINAGLVPALSPQALGLATAGSWGLGYNSSYTSATPSAECSAGLLPGPSKSKASLDNYHGVDAAAVPAHVTPLGKERSGGSVSQAGSGADADQNAGGQLHWNPLYDPNASAGSPVMGY